MNRFLLAALALLPAIPAAVHLARALRSRTGRRAGSIIVWGALTMVAGVAVYAGVAISMFSTVATVRPEDKATVLSLGLARGSLALATGLIVGALLCVVGGITRTLFRPGVERP
jgi:uncharacterized membrane protein YjfL (UPF0719 family)